MTEQQKILWYKPVTVGCEKLPAELESELRTLNILNINIKSDSDELNSQLILTGAHKPDTDQIPWATITYLTKQQLPLKKRNGQILQTMDIDYPGDLYASPLLDQYYFYGIDKLGTLLSMIYGIRSFVGIEQGRLGLHSSLIYDKESKHGHLLVGRNKIGKSTIGQIIEEYTDRFIMVADDWVEVELTSDIPIVVPISPIFSPSNPTQNYELAMNSFGKPFYWKHNVHPLPLMRLGKIIELYPDNYDMDSDRFLITALSHIPFLSQEINKDMFVCPILESSNTGLRISSRKQKVASAYRQITTSYETIQIVNDHGNTTAEQASVNVLDALLK